MFGRNDKRRYDNHDHTKGLERRLEVTVVRIRALEVQGGWDGDGEAACHALQPSNDGGALLGILLLLTDDLAKAVGHMSNQAAGE